MRQNNYCTFDISEYNRKYKYEIDENVYIHLA